MAISFLSFQTASWLPLGLKQILLKTKVPHTCLPQWTNWGHENKIQYSSCLLFIALFHFRMEDSDHPWDSVKEV